jgi:hypothetical protein
MSQSRHTYLTNHIPECLSYTLKKLPLSRILL